MKYIIVLLFAFVALCNAFPKHLKDSRETKEIKNKVMNFNYEVEEFLNGIRDDKEGLLSGQDQNITEDALKVFKCISSKVGLLDSIRNVLSTAYKMILKKELKTPSHQKFCQNGGYATKVFKDLKSCIKTEKKRSPFLNDLFKVINGSEAEICSRMNLPHKLAVFERFREEIDSKHFENAFKRFEELQKDCTKLKKEDHCLPQKLTRAFEAEAIKSQAFEEDSQKIYVNFARIYFTTAIKAPYKRSSECYTEIQE